jgi:hypothetical protein
MAGWAGMALAAAPLSDGRVQLWVGDGDGLIWSSCQVAFDWTYWNDSWAAAKAAFVAKQFAAARLADQRVQFWAVDTSGVIWSCSKSAADSDSAWTAWTSQWTAQAPTFKAVQVAAASLSDGPVQFWAVDTSGVIWSWDSSSGWTAQHTTFQVTQLAAAPLSDGRLRLWAVDTGGGIWSCSRTAHEPNSDWTDWALQAAPFHAAQIAAGRLSDGRLQLWAIDAGGGIWSCWKLTADANSAWTAWTKGWIADATGFQARALCCAPLVDGRSQVWVIDTNGQVRVTLKSTTDAGSAWTNWSLMFPMMRQEQTNWCWSGCSTGVSHFYSPRSQWAQCTLANAELNMETCCEDGESCNQYGVLNSALETVGHFDRFTDVQEEDAVLTAQANQGQPVGVRIEWREGGGAHFILVVGGGANNMITIKDPWYGQLYITYETLQSNYQALGDWTHSYFTKP